MFGKPRYSILLTFQIFRMFMWAWAQEPLIRFCERAFSYIAPRILNRLPASLKESDSIATFNLN